MSDDEFSNVIGLRGDGIPYNTYLEGTQAVNALPIQVEWSCHLMNKEIEMYQRRCQNIKITNLDRFLLGTEIVWRISRILT